MTTSSFAQTLLTHNKNIKKKTDLIIKPLGVTRGPKEIKIQGDPHQADKKKNEFLPSF